MEMSINYSLIKSIEDVRLLSHAYLKGLIMKPKISKIAAIINADRETVRKALNGFVPKKTKDRRKYLDDFRDIMLELLKDEYKEFDYIQHLFNYMQRESSIDCSYSTFRRYIKNDEE
ncbi:MAG: hypothetical protein U9Q80_04855, partial [Bacillota bacterium]|nr:hypothetical protein [Bacillota bacterium]